MILILCFVLLSGASRICSEIPILNLPVCQNPYVLTTGCASVNGLVDCTPRSRVRQVPGNSKTKVTCTPTDQGFRDCDKCVNGGNKCSGDSYYCARFQCKKEHKCYCTLQDYNTITEYEHRGLWRTGFDINISFSFDESNPIFYSGNQQPFGVQISQTSRNIVARTVTSITYENTRITVVTPNPDSTRVLATKDGLSQFFTCASVDCLIQLPDTYFINPGVLTVKTYLNDTLDKESTFTLNSYSRCKVPGCIFCWDLYQDFTCFPPAFQAFFVTTILAMCLASILILIFMTRIFWICCLRVKCCVSCRKRSSDMVKMTFNKIKNSRKNVVKKAEFDPMDDNEGVFMEDPTPMRLIPEVRTVALIILLALPLVLSAPCNQGITIPTQISTCYASGDTEECMAEFETLISIPSTGLASCLTFKTPEDEPIGDLVITYDQSTEIAPLQSEYFTAAWQGVSMSDKQCPWEHMCGSCGSFDPISDPGAGGLIFGLPLWYPGVTRCDSQCGCAGCGCFACDASCVYSRAALMAPTSEIGQVLRPISVRIQPRLIANFTSGSESQLHTVDITGFDMQIGLNFSLTIQGSLTGSTTQFGDQRVVVTSASATLGAASAPNSPVKGAVGDIQANSPGQFSPFQTFKYASGLWTALPTSSQTNYLFEGAGWSSRSGHDTLPTIRGSTLWTYSNGNLVGLNSNPGSVIATIRTQRPVRVSRKVNIVCPEIFNATLDGCYSCDQGATISVWAKSRCSEGSALATVDGTYTIATPSVVLTTEPTLIQIKVTSTKAQNSGKLKLTSGRYSSEFLVEGTLVYEDIIVNQNQTLSNTTSNLPTITDFAGWFNGLKDWMKGLLVTGMVIFAIVATIVAIVIFVKVYRAVRRANTEAKYEKLQEDEKNRLIREMQIKAMMESK